MSLLTIVLIASISVFVLSLLKSKIGEQSKSKKNGVLKSLGLLALVLGMLGQFIGLFGAFGVIESGMNISPALLAGGLKVSMITTIYGMIIFLLSYLMWFAMGMLKK